MPNVGSPAFQGATNPFDGAAATLPFATVTTAAELIAAINLQNASGVGGAIYCAPGTYVFPSGAGPTIRQAGCEIIGSGYASVIEFHPSAHDQAAFLLDRGSAIGTLNYCAIRGFTFTSPDTTFRKIMISHVDTWGFRVSDINCSDGAWGDASFQSEGVRSKGRFRHHFYDSTIHTDIPLRIMANPYLPGLEADHFYFGPCLDLASNNGNPTIKVDAGVVLTNTTFSGIALQKGGFSWAGTNATASLSVRFEKIRCEQFSAGQWAFDINGTTRIQSLSFDVIRIAATGNGIRARSVSELNLTQIFDGGSVVGLDLDGTTFDIKGDNVHMFSPTSISLVNQKLVRAGSLSEVVSPLPSPFFEYQSTLSINAITTTELGLRKITFLSTDPGFGPLASGSSRQLADTFTNTEKSIRVEVFARNAATGEAVCGWVGVTVGATGTAVCPAPTASFDAGNVLGPLVGKLSVWREDINNLKLLNLLGVAVDYAVEMTVYK